MKKIEAIIREESLNELKDCLEKNGFFGMTVYKVKGRGIQKGINLEWRAGSYRVDLLPKIMVMLVVNDQDVDKVIDLIIECCSSGTAGDGKIFISTIEEVVRISTKEKGIKAI
ncbi:P-II family nitrogen regulator [Caldicellulosiruptoraceae bacterium PP1]